MRKRTKTLISSCLAAMLITTNMFLPVSKPVTASAAGPSFTSVGGYLESIYAQISGVKDSDVTGVSYSGAMSGSLTGQDLEFLVRDENGGVRIDIPGLKAGTYSLEVTTKSGNITQSNIEVAANDRSGYAHFNYTDGVGAYKDDGTLKDNAIVIYVTNENKNTVTVRSKDGTTVSGIGNILNSAGGKIRTDVKNPNKVLSTVINTNQDIIRKLAEDGTPLVVRIIGRVKDDGDPSDKGDKIDGLTQFDGYDYGGSVGDNGNMARMQSGKDITIEGIGHDAVIDGWGIHFIAQTAYKNFGKSFEVRNISFENVPEDCVGMEGVQSGTELTASVERCWIHNCNFYVPKIAVPAESDKSEGDGACDFKRGQYFTNSYCYYDGYHKTNLVGSSDSSLQYNITYHHNYWKNCESRGPLGRQANIHMYNNIFENQISYAMNTRANCYIFSEYNLFYMVKSPMSVDSGAIKSYNDSFSTCINDMGGTIVTNKNTPVNTSNKYANFDTNSSLSYIPGGKYDLQESVTDARRVIYAYTGVMKSNPVTPEEVTDDLISYLPSGVTPTSVTTFPTTLVSSSEKVSKTVKAFTVDRNFDITVKYANDAVASTGVLVNEAGESFLLGSGELYDLPAGTYMIQPMNFQPGKSGAAGSFKEVTITSLVINSQETGPSESGHRHHYVITESKDATCTEAGYEVHTCDSQVGECKRPSYRTEIPAGHKYSEAWTVDVPATEDSEGEKSHHCMICGDRTDITKIPKLSAGGGDVVVDGDYAHNFTVSGMDSSVYTINGSLSTSKGSVIYGSENLTRCLKMESKTNIEFIAPSSGKLILVFGGDTSASGKKVSVNGKSYTCGTDGIATVDIAAGRTQIKKDDGINLFYMNFIPESTTVTTYPITVQVEGKGTAKANAASAAAGATVILTATPDSGYVFKEWQAWWGADNHELVVSANNTFQMPAQAVVVKAVFINQNEEYDIALTTDGNGTAEASATKAKAGTEITLTATPKSGYKFKEWQVTEGGVTVSANKFTMPGNAVTIKAVFEEGQTSDDNAEYDITVVSDGNGIAEASAAKAKAGTKITLTATPKSGYKFKEWQVTGNAVTIADDSFTMPEAAVTITAVFEVDNAPTQPEQPTQPETGVTLTLNASDATAATLTANKVQSGFVITANSSNTVVIDANNGTLDDNTKVTKRIKLGGTGNEEYRSIKVTTAGASTITVYARSSNNSDDRTLILLDKEGNQVGAGKTVTASSKQPVKLEFSVSEAGDYYVASQSGGLNIYYMTATNAIPAKEEAYDVTVTDDGNGAAIAKPSKAESGTKITLEATPKAGFEFKEWQVVSGGVTIGSDGTFTMPASAVEIKAVFEKVAEKPEVKTYDVTVTDDGNGAATAKPSKAESGTKVTLTATPKDGYQFKEWQVVSGGVTIGSDNSFTMPAEAVTVKAVFEKTPDKPTIKTYDITVTSDGNGTAASSIPTAQAGVKVTLTATPNSGYKFKEWQVIWGGITIGADGSFTMPESSVTVKAVFEKEGENPTDPTKPTDPTDPTKPTDPTDPTKPEDPENEIATVVKKEIPADVMTDEIKQATGCDTVEELTSYLRTEIKKASVNGAEILPDLAPENTSALDITVMVSTDGGENWNKATKDNFPASGVDVVIPYPDGTNSSDYDFVVGHLITQGWNGMTVGAMEYFNPDKTDEGLKIHIKSASPFVVGWKQIQADTPEPGDNGGNDNDGNDDGDDEVLVAQEPTTAQQETKPAPAVTTPATAESTKQEASGAATGDNAAQRIPALMIISLISAIAATAALSDKRRRNR